MKRFAIITVVLAAALILIGCSGKNSRWDATSVGKRGWVFEGWACAPNQAKALKGQSPADYCDTDDISKNKYLYMKFSASAKQSVVDEGRIGKLQSSCRDAAKRQIQGDSLEKILGTYLEGAAGVEDGESTGHVIMAQYRGRIKGIGVYNCCPLDQDSGECMKPGTSGYAKGWAECMCVGYLAFPGGQKAFQAAAESADAE